MDEQETLGEPKGRVIVERTLPYGRRFGTFWSNGWDDFRDNIKIAWPIFVALLVYLLISGTILYYKENSINPRVNTWPDALYQTWTTMTTIGNPDPQTVLGKVVTSLDGFIGIVFIGSIVWLVTESLGVRSRRSGAS